MEDYIKLLSGILFLSIFLSCSKKVEEELSLPIKRAEKAQVLLFDGQKENSELSGTLLKLLAKDSLRVDSSRSVLSLDEDSLRPYAALVIWGCNGSELPPRARQEIERYLESGGGVLWLNSEVRDTLSWYLMEKRLREMATGMGEVIGDSTGKGEEKFLKMPSNVGRFAAGSIDSTDVNVPLMRVKMAEALEFVMGENLYFEDLISLPELPRDQRFIVKVLDDDMNEPMELAVMPDGKVIFIERRGIMKLYDPKEEETKILATFDVCTHGNYEDGLLGLCLDPDFPKNNYLYLYYSPSSGCEIGEQYLSRFTMLGDSIILESEKVVLKVPVQRETCCHSGGSLAFGPDGYLYLSTGDNTSSKESDGYTPIDERPGRGPFDAQKSSSNTHDLRGKVLRIKPNKYGSYDIPEDNLFSLDGIKGRPEIYVMGARNPFRISIDGKNGALYWGDVGPDAGVDSRYGSESFDEWNRATGPGNYGWPYFMANNVAFPERDFETDQVGEAQDPFVPVNCSPNNYGAEMLPPANPAWIWYPYGVSKEFPGLGKGSRSAMAGPIFYREFFADSTDTPFPDYYEGKMFIYEWARGWIKVVESDTEGRIQEIEPFLPDMDLVKPIDIEFGPEGSMYILDYGKDYFLNNPKARLMRVTYAPDNVPPEVEAYAEVTEGDLPARVHFDASATYDYDEIDSVLQFEWSLYGGDQADMVGEEFCFTYPEKGVYHPKLWVIDHNCDTVEEEFEVVIGNKKPAFRLEQPRNRSFYRKDGLIAYKLDLEDEAPIAASRLSVKAGFLPQDALESGKIPVWFGTSQPRGARLIHGSDCFSCHNVERASIGPSYQEVARRYQNDPSSRGMLAEKIIKGGGGNWGGKMMAAHPDVSEEEALAMVDYIMSLPGEPRGKAMQGRMAFDAGMSNPLFLVEASYEDGGYQGLPPQRSRETLILKDPRLEAENAERVEGMWKSTFGPNRDKGQLNVGGPGSGFGFAMMDLTDLRRVRIRYSSQGSLRISLRLGDAEGPVIGNLNLGSSASWTERSFGIKETFGRYPVYFRVESGSRAEIDWIEWEF